MRISEKTIELNFCAQLSKRVRPPIIWYGLTQAEEALDGYDAKTLLAGQHLFFQFKASRENVSGCRRFRVDHDQMMKLRNLSIANGGGVFYVFPTVGTRPELATANGEIFSTSYLLDVATLPKIPTPTTAKGTPRISGIHYVDIPLGPPSPGAFATIHSDPVQAPLIPAESLQVGKERSGMKQINLTRVWRLPTIGELAKTVRGSAVGAFVNP